MNQKDKDAIEKAALKRIEEQHFLGLDGRYKTAYLLGATWGATFGYNLALKHCQVLREAVEIGINSINDGEYEVLRNVLRAKLCSFDKLIAEEENWD